MEKLTVAEKKNMSVLARDYSSHPLDIALHSGLVAKEAEEVALSLGRNSQVDQRICWIAGLLHELTVEEPYILAGTYKGQIPMLLSSISVGRVLHRLEYNGDLKDRVNDAILRHNIPLKPGWKPIEDVILSNAHAGAFFKYYRSEVARIYHTIERQGTPMERMERVRERMLRVSDAREGNITLPELKQEYGPYVDRFHRSIGGVSTASILTAVCY